MTSHPPHFTASRSPRDLYDPRFVASLFNDMAATYGVVNLISSFGFCRLWRRQCAEAIDLPPSAAVVDLMSGMGELWPNISRHRGGPRIVGLDLSETMCRKAERDALPRCPNVVGIIQGDALRSGLADASADAVFSSFGLKTFSPEQQMALAVEVARILKPGGWFSFLEISIPKFALLRWPYQFYLNAIIPNVGRLMLGNPDCYRMLGVYTERFGNASHFVDCCCAVGLTAELKFRFFGCATAAVGQKQ